MEHLPTVGAGKNRAIVPHGESPYLIVLSKTGPNNQLIMDDRHSFRYDAERSLRERPHDWRMAVETLTWDDRKAKHHANLGIWNSFRPQATGMTINVLFLPVE